MEQVEDQDPQQQIEYTDLVKSDVIALYKEKSEESKLEPHDAFMQYLEETYDENNNIDIVIPGNHKQIFTYRVTDNHLIVICTTLERYAVYIEEIDLRYNQITDIGAKALGDLISKCPRLMSLNLQGNHIKSEGAQYLAEALKECTNLQSLNLNNNKIKTNGAMMVTELLFTHDKLLSLNLGNNKIDHDGVIGILSVLNSSNYNLEELNIDNPVYRTICQSVAIHFGKMFQNNVGLQKLSIRKHKLRDDGIYIIMEHLLENNTLKVLDLNANEIAFKGCEAIAKYLKGENCSLESLHLANNKCSDYGAKAIAQALAVNKSLIHLDMTYNDINDFGLTLFAQSLTQNSTLMSFKIFGNHFGQQCLKLFCGLFESERENPWFPDFVVYFVDDHFEMAYLETNIENETDLGIDIHVNREQRLDNKNFI